MKLVFDGEEEYIAAEHRARNVSKFVLGESPQWGVVAMLLADKHQHIDTAVRIFGDPQTHPKAKDFFLGAGTITIERACYDSDSCRSESDGFGRDRPENQERGEALLVELRDRFEAWLGGNLDSSS
jgi:hypothetical protein